MFYFNTLADAIVPEGKKCSRSEIFALSIFAILVLNRENKFRETYKIEQPRKFVPQSLMIFQFQLVTFNT